MMVHCLCAGAQAVEDAVVVPVGVEPSGLEAKAAAQGLPVCLDNLGAGDLIKLSVVMIPLACAAVGVLEALEAELLEVLPAWVLLLAFLEESVALEYWAAAVQLAGLESGQERVEDLVAAVGTEV